MAGGVVWGGREQGEVIGGPFLYSYVHHNEHGSYQYVSYVRVGTPAIMCVLT